MENEGLNLANGLHVWKRHGFSPPRLGLRKGIESKTTRILLIGPLYKSIPTPSDGFSTENLTSINVVHPRVRRIHSYFDANKGAKGAKGAEGVPILWRASVFDGLGARRRHPGQPASPNPEMMLSAIR